jgi:hypothetical protein
MDQASGYVKAEAQKPQYQQQHEYGPEHVPS